MGRREEGERRNRKGNKLREPFRARFILVRLGGVHNAPCSAFSCEARPLWAHETKKEHIYYAGWVAAATPPLGLIRSVSLYNATPTTTPLRVFLPFSLSLSLSLPLSLSLSAFRSPPSWTLTELIVDAHWRHYTFVANATRCIPVLLEISRRNETGGEGIASTFRIAAANRWSIDFRVKWIHLKIGEENFG